MSLIGHWRASGASGTNVPDISGGGLNGTMTAGCSIVTVPTTGETAIRCPGGSDCIEVADDAKWNLGDCTLMVRFQRDTYTDPAPLITHTPGGGLVDKLFFGYLQGVVVGSIPSLVLQGRAPAGFQVVSNPYQNTFNSVVTAWMTRSGSDVTFGLNDVIIGTASFGTTFPDVAEPLRFGSGLEATFNGAVSIVAVRIYNTALSFGDVQTAYLADAAAPLPTPSANSQIGRWRAFQGEEGGDDFPNRLTVGVDGAVGAQCSWVTDGDCPAVFCDDGGAPPITVPAGLTDQSQCIVVPQDARWRLDGGDFALIARASFTDSAHIQGLAGCNEGTDGNNFIPMWAFYTNPPAGATTLQFTWTEANNANVRHTAVSPAFTSTLLANTWGLAVVRSGDDFTFYSYDGATFTAIGTDTEAGAVADDIVAPLYIGRGGNQSRDGTDQTVSSFRMFNYALDAAAVEAAMLEDLICTQAPQARARILADCGDPIFVNPCPDPDAP